ncbi:MAG: sigma-70 family RNA polymerase sigma factor [Saprospiraceae bacterium]|nr:sigma-70 family RNA polymerase sigma factor [Saprospiraceae bacterium]
MNSSTRPSNDEQIIALLRLHDTSGMSLLYDKYSGALFGAILRVVHSQEIAEEVLQDTFTKAWRNFESYDNSKGRLFTWLINIARNSAIDATRQKGFNRQNQSLENVVNTIDTQQSTSINPETIDMKQLTERLSPEYKDLIDLIYFQGYTQSEAAEALNIPLGTVKTRVRAAMVRLKEFFN